MAQILEQSEIDALLNQSITDDDQESEEKSPKNGDGKPPRKHFKAYVTRETRFHFSYESPVFKRRSLVVNPGPAVEDAPGRVVVRTLDNYQEYVRSRREENGHADGNGNGKSNGGT